MKTIAEQGKKVQQGTSREWVKAIGYENQFKNKANKYNQYGWGERSWLCNTCTTTSREWVKAIGYEIQFNNKAKKYNRGFEPEKKNNHSFAIYSR